MVYYLGAKPTLGHYANTKLLDGDPRKIEVADVTPDAGFDLTTSRAYPANQGRAIRTEHVPTRIQWQERAPVPDVEIQHGMIIFPERFREIVETFEPGVHQFLPVTYVDRSGNILAQRHYFIACNRLDSVDRTHTTGFLLWRDCRWIPIGDFIRNMPDLIPPGFDTSKPPRQVFNCAQIGDSHAWCDMFAPMSGVHLSNRLGDAIKAEAFSGISIGQQPQV